MNNEKKPTREEIVRSLRICAAAICEGCGGCIFESETTGTLGEMCGDAIRHAAADLIDELTDRCARYAEEIMELRQRLKKYENAEMLAAQQNEKGCPFKYWCDAVQTAKNNNEKENTMKIFISQPMRGKTNEEIKTERERLIAKAREHYGEDIEVIDSFFENAPADARPLWFLGKSLELLSTADVAVFAPDWESARGCRVENHCAIIYGIEVMEVCGK